MQKAHYCYSESLPLVHQQKDNWYQKVDRTNIMAVFLTKSLRQQKFLTQYTAMKHLVPISNEYLSDEKNDVVVYCNCVSKLLSNTFRYAQSHSLDRALKHISVVKDEYSCCFIL